MAESTPSSFANVEVRAKANIYFEGKVVSRTVVFPDGSKKTLGLIFPGSFHFDTDARERMQIIAGSCRVRVEGDSWRSYEAGGEFHIGAKSGFDIAVESGIAEYICSFE